MILFDRQFPAARGAVLCGLRTSGRRRLFHQSHLDWRGRVLPQAFCCSATLTPNLFHQFHLDWHTSRVSCYGFGIWQAISNAPDRLPTQRFVCITLATFISPIALLMATAVTSSLQTALVFWGFCFPFCSQLFFTNCSVTGRLTPDHCPTMMHV